MEGWGRERPHPRVLCVLVNRFRDYKSGGPTQGTLVQKWRPRCTWTPRSEIPVVGSVTNVSESRTLVNVSDAGVVQLKPIPAPWMLNVPAPLGKLKLGATGVSMWAHDPVPGVGTAVATPTRPPVRIRNVPALT